MCAVLELVCDQLACVAWWAEGRAAGLSLQLRMMPASGQPTVFLQHPLAWGCVLTLLQQQLCLKGAAAVAWHMVRLADA
jgi:hypothetical protein